MLSLNLPFMSVKDRANLYLNLYCANLYSSFVYYMSDDAVYCIESVIFLSSGEAKVLWFFCQQEMKGLP